MSELMTAPVSAPTAHASVSTPPAPVETHDIFEQPVPEGKEEVGEIEIEVVEAVVADSSPADELLDFTKQHGIEEGFEFLAYGKKGEEFNTKQQEIEESGEEVKPKQETEERKTPEQVQEGEQKSLEEQFVELHNRVVELTNGQEELQKEMMEITKRLAQSQEVTHATVLVLYELVKKLHEQEEDKKRKESLWMLLAKLTGFLTASLFVKPEEAEKQVLKK